MSSILLQCNYVSTFLFLQFDRFESSSLSHNIFQLESFDADETLGRNQAQPNNNSTIHNSEIIMDVISMKSVIRQSNKRR